MNSQVLNQRSVLCHLLPPYDKYVVHYLQNNNVDDAWVLRVCVYDTWSMCTIQVHSFWCYYYTSETLAKKSSKAQSREAHRRVRAGLEGGRGKGKEQQEGKERLQYGWGGCGSEDSQAVEQVKAKTSDDSPIRMLPKTDLANQSLILRSSLEGATFFLSCEYPAHHYWHGFNFFFFV